jgi:murein DD-endopeptidase MepM/ murein hydrolase activator NlpD
MAEGTRSSFKVAELYSKEPDQTLIMPLRTVRAKQLKDSRRAPRDGGERLHEGQNIFAPCGTPIYSATNGYVVRVGESNPGGQTVSVMGAGGRIYYYAHLDGYAPDLSAGNLVTPETVLGYVGTTGNAKGSPPHLLQLFPLRGLRGGLEFYLNPTRLACVESLVGFYDIG